MTAEMGRQPDVSIAVACYNAAAFLEDAVRSALGQRGVSVEVIVVDDGSVDASQAIAAALAAVDPRVRPLSLPRNGGPSAARNAAIEAARGRWFAVLDSDDLLHPDRLSRLLAGAEADGADIVADNLLLFSDGAPEAATGFFHGARANAPTWLGLEDYLKETRLLISRSNLGYVKPVIRLEALKASGVRYNEALRIGEDDDLMLRLLNRGLTCRLYPEFGYFYRRHAGSISHRLSEEALDRMRAQAQAFRAEAAGRSAAIDRALLGRDRAIAAASAFQEAVVALKARRPLKALLTLAGTPLALIHLRFLLEGLARRLPGGGRPEAPAATPSARGREICLISRQRLIGNTNGSSRYLLGLALALRDAGHRVHLLQPSPGTLGRWPVLKLKPEMGLFASISIRGAVRFGAYVFAADPLIYLAAARAVAAHLLRLVRLPSAWISGAPAPYAIAAPWTAADQLYVSRIAPRRADVVVFDYAFQAEMFPFALRPRAPSAIIMHDLFHARTTAGGPSADTVPEVGEAEEARLLLMADVVVAIQETEAAYVRSLQGPRVILAPVAVEAAASPAAGADDTAVFIGSNTAPNRAGLEWFFEAVWPEVRRTRPAARLTVVGNVSRGLSGTPEGVVLAGVVEDLAGVYKENGVVISPLTAGSGLKIKLIEALGYGKAVVATSITLQGVRDVSAAVVVADEAEAFAAALGALLGDGAARGALGERALALARAQFSLRACYGELLDWVAAAR